MDHLVVEITNYRSFIGEPVRLEFPHGGFLGLVGTNNAGKSSLLRMFWELRPLFATLRRCAERDNPIMRGLLAGAAIASEPTHATLPGERIFPTESDRDPTIMLHFAARPAGVPREHWPKSCRVTLRRHGGFELLFVMHDRVLQPASSDAVPTSHRPLYRVGHRTLDVTPLGSLAALLEGAVYIGPFRNSINIGAQHSYFDLSIGDAFINQLAGMKAGPDATANEAVFELTEEIARIFKFKSLDINPAPDGKSIQLIVNGRSFRSSELGAGLAHFVLAAATVLLKRPALLLIDEPELNLHPALQVDFLTMLASYASFSVGYSTHSLGLARSTADRLYAVTRDEAGVSTCLPYEASPELASLLGQLGYSAFNDFQYEGVLLVEGITDVRTFLQLLRLYGKEHRFAIVPLGGQDFMKRDVAVELAELTRLSNNVVAVLDSERPAADAPIEPGRLAFAEACKDLGVQCHFLERRSIESYLPERAVQAVYGPTARALDPYESTKTAPFGWSKHKNWRVAREVTFAELEMTDLGAILGQL